MRLRLDDEGLELAKTLKYLAGRVSFCKVISDDASVEEFHALRAKVARKALAYCRDRGISHWDFLEMVEG